MYTLAQYRKENQSVASVLACLSLKRPKPAHERCEQRLNLKPTEAAKLRGRWPLRLDGQPRSSSGYRRRRVVSRREDRRSLVNQYVLGSAAFYRRQPKNAAAAAGDGCTSMDHWLNNAQAGNTSVMNKHVLVLRNGPGHRPLLSVS